MSEPAPRPRSVEAPDTFCVYLARQFIAKRGFAIGTVPEARRIAIQSDIVLSFFDGFSLNIIAMIDREANPGKTFTLFPDEIEEIGKACLEYSGRMNGARAPVKLQLMEIGASSKDQSQRMSAIKRPSLFSKLFLSAWIIDTDHCSVWTTAGWSERSLRRFIEELLVLPRERVTTPPVFAVASPAFPALTIALIVAVGVTFAAEIAFGIGPSTRLLQPTIATLVTLGGLSRTLVLELGEWYRLLSAPFLHVDLPHLVMNGFALLIAGSILETLIGRAWFGAVYAVGALCGSLASLALNPPSIVSVGASGAIMGLFAAMLVVSLRFPVGPTRTSLQMNAMYVLIPSVLPLASVLKGQRVDYAAHFGGVLAGAALGAVMLTIWSRAEPRPKWRLAVAVFPIAGVVALAFPIIGILHKYPSMAFTSQLIPADKLPRTAPTTAQSLDLVTRYPRDPRGHLIRATYLLDARDLAGAEGEARTGLAEQNLWGPMLPQAVSTNLRVVLALSIANKNRDEAIAVARPVCDSVKSGPQRTLLDSQKLCGM